MGIIITLYNVQHACLKNCQNTNFCRIFNSFRNDITRLTLNRILQFDNSIEYGSYTYNLYFM